MLVGMVFKELLNSVRVEAKYKPVNSGHQVVLIFDAECRRNHNLQSEGVTTVVEHK